MKVPIAEIPHRPNDTVHRVVIAGPPVSGKSIIMDHYCAGWMRIPTDNYMTVPWKDQPRVIMEELKEDHDWHAWMLGGVTAARCLRAGLEADVVVWAGEDYGRTSAHAIMAAGVWTVFEEWRKKLGLEQPNRWGVTVYELWRRRDGVEVPADREG